MSVRIVSLSDIEPKKLPGRDLQWIVTPETIGAEKLSITTMTVPAHKQVGPSAWLQAPPAIRRC